MARLKEGSQAPIFFLKDPKGKKYSPIIRGQGKIWLAFYRYARCPLCRDHLTDVIAREQEIAEAGGTFIAVFESERMNFRQKPYSKSKLPFPFIMDPKKRLYKLYKLEKSWLGLFHPMAILGLFKALFRGFGQGKIEGELGQLPAHFLINENGVIETAFYGVHVGHHIHWSRVAQFMGFDKEFASSKPAKTSPSQLPQAKFFPPSADALGLLPVTEEPARFNMTVVEPDGEPNSAGDVSE